jgi:hypothetical protein
MTKELPKDVKRKLEILAALEAAGVDNWDGYDFAMEEIRKRDELEENAAAIIDEICSILSEGVTQPAGYGCGYGFSPTVVDEAVDYLMKRRGDLK